MPVTDADIATLANSHDIIDIGMRADAVRREKHGNRTTFLRVTVIDATHFSVGNNTVGVYTSGGVATSAQIVITTAAPHGLPATGTTVTMSGVGGNTAGFEDFFRELSDMGGALRADPEALAALNARYGLEMRPETLPAICEEHGLTHPMFEAMGA